MSQMNINKGWESKWQEWEDSIIREYYPKNGYEKVLELLPNRNKAGIQSRASKLRVSYLSYDENYFQKIDSENKAYWLGFLYTDGYITTNNRWGLEISIIDIQHLKNLLDEMQCNINIKIRERKSPTTDNVSESCSFQINNKTMYDSLLKNGVVPNKTDILNFPSDEIMPNKYLSDFIRGLFDGDGSIVFYEYEYIRKDRNNKKYTRICKEISFICKSEEFIKTLKDIIYEECGVEFNLSYNSRDKLPTLRLSNSDSMKKFLTYIYQNKNQTNYLMRKYEKAQEIFKYCLL